MAICMGLLYLMVACLETTRDWYSDVYCSWIGTTPIPQKVAPTPLPAACSQCILQIGWNLEIAPFHYQKKDIKGLSNEILISIERVTSLCFSGTGESTFYTWVIYKATSLFSLFSHQDSCQNNCWKKSGTKCMQSKRRNKLFVFAMFVVVPFVLRA